MRRLSPVFALFFLAPLVAEFFLGDFPVVEIFLLPVFALMYGGGALLIREIVRRTGRGWPAMLVLALAFGLLEEGLITQSLFNPDYLDAHLLDHGYIGALHTALPWLFYVLALHTFWSISVPVEIVEESTPSRRATPWLGWKGLTVVAVLFVVGLVAVYNANLQLNHNFKDSAGEIVGTLIGVVVLVVVALLIPRPRRAAKEGPVPNGWVAGATAVAGGLIYKAGLILPLVPGIIAFLLGPAIVLVLVAIWSRRVAWGPEQRLGIAGGTLLTYSWGAFFSHSAGFALDLVSHVIYLLAAAAILYWAAKRIKNPS
jgi:hypothetical protein